MDTIVMKFGGSSLADNNKLKTVAQKIINMYNKDNNIVAILSAQGKTTDKLINEASKIIEENEKDNKKFSGRSDGIPDERKCYGRCTAGEAKS